MYTNVLITKLQAMRYLIYEQFLIQNPDFLNFSGRFIEEKFLNSKLNKIKNLKIW